MAWFFQKRKSADDVVKDMEATFARMFEERSREALAADVEMPPPPKGKPANALPSFVKSSQSRSDTFLPQEDPLLANADLSALRNSSRSTAELIRKLAKASPDISAAVYAAVRMAVSCDYVVLARNMDGTINPEGTKLVQQLARRFDLLGLPTGYIDTPTLRSTAESLGGELMIEGAMALELVLGKARAPESLRPISVSKIKWKVANNRKIPYQVIGQDEISLDVPTFFYTSLDQDLTRAYADSPLQSALQPAQASQDFLNDLRRVARRAVHPRIKAKIATESWLRSLPPDVRNDYDKLRTAQNSAVSDIQSVLDGLNPEDALVNFDLVEFDYLVGGNNSLSDEYKVMSGIIDGKQAAGAKTSGTVLGHGAGSQNIASTESVLFVKAVEGAVQFKFNEIYSRVFTTALRLFGVEATAEFKYSRINLRPELELESFKAMRQSRLLEQVSIGMTPWVEASLELTGSLPPSDMPDLTGTGFMTISKADPAANPTSNTSDGQGGALNQSLSSTAPKKAKS